MIDLRSDTVTRPTAEMRRVMANAEVGDGVIDIDPTVQRLEEETARVLGKEAALFVPSGTMANQVAVRAHCPRGAEFLCESQCHLYNWEQGAFAQLSGLVARPVASDFGTLRLEHLRDKIRPDDDHYVRTQLLTLENTHNRWGGRVSPQDDIDEACQWARGNGVRTHLDGARLWNASIATGLSPAKLAEPFDSVSVCFSKGLGAPVGSALAGSADFIAEARRGRKCLGGAMRQAGIVAAGALHALQCHRDRLYLDHEAAQTLAEVADNTSVLSICGDRVDTNIVMFDVDPDWGSATQMQQQLQEGGVDCFAVGASTLRLVTHLDVAKHQVHTARDLLMQITHSAAVPA